MSICSGIGNGIGGALGKWGAGLGSALGLGAVVDLGTRAYTGYGLLDILSVPYIECPDGSFASAIEWYGAGLKCPKKVENTELPDPGKSPGKAAKDYNDAIESLGGAVYPYVGSYSVAPINSETPAEVRSGHFQPKSTQVDSIGNTINTGKITEETGWSHVRGFGGTSTYKFSNDGWGGWSGTVAPAGYNYRDIRTHEQDGRFFANAMRGGTIIGVRVGLPSLPIAPPSASIPPPPGFSLPPYSPPEECEMACPCISPKDKQSNKINYTNN